jgi:hypothetical protein
MATHKYYRFVALGMLCFLALSLPGNAESADGDKWEFHIAPYVWLAGQKGDVATLPGLPATGVDVNFYDDILGNINFAGMLIGEARKGRVGVMADVIYTDIEDKAATPGPFFSGISSRTKSWIVTAAGTLPGGGSGKCISGCVRRNSVLVRGLDAATENRPSSRTPQIQYGRLG